MRKILFLLIFILSISFSSCSKDDDDKLCLICEVEGEASSLRKANGFCKRKENK